MFKRFVALFLCVMLLLSGCATAPAPTEPVVSGHVDADDNGKCDDCKESLMVSLNFYSVNDLHGKLADGDNHPGVDELTTYLKDAQKRRDNVIILSAGDMWQGSPESNLTAGQLATDWMNDVGFTAMALGNHEFDWGTEAVKTNAEIAEFPFLAINIYDRETNQRVDYCDSSVMVDTGEIQVGIIGAIGDCYSSISPDQVEDIYFKVEDELTQLVMAESEKLRSEGADYIVYVIHDGYGSSESTSSAVDVSDNKLKSYYDVDLSDGYVDLVFEAHTHQGYLLRDTNGVFHLQGKGENKAISHVEVQVNSVTGTTRTRMKEVLANGTYANYADDPIIQDLMEKYADVVSIATEQLGHNAAFRNSDFLNQKVADLYYQVGLERWGKDYDIALGGGFIAVRSPYQLLEGVVEYGDLQMVLPFDNQIVLCSVKGRDLKEKFFESTHDKYHISYGSYGKELRNNIDPNETYYLVTDSYTSQYGPNRLTVVEWYDEGVYARDLFADYIREGGLE